MSDKKELNNLSNQEVDGKSIKGGNGAINHDQNLNGRDPNRETHGHNFRVEDNPTGDHSTTRVDDEVIKAPDHFRR